MSPTTIVQAWLERLDHKWGEDFGWQKESRAFVQRDNGERRTRPSAASKLRAAELVRHREFEAVFEENLLDHVFISPLLWQGTVTLPDNPEGTTRYRLVIAEYEEYLVDDATPYDLPVTKKDRRLVFVEHVALD